MHAHACARARARALAERSRRMNLPRIDSNREWTLRELREEDLSSPMPEMGLLSSLVRE